MATTPPIRNAIAATAALSAAWPGEIPVTDETELFAEFLRICGASHGKPVPGMPKDIPLRLASGTEVTYRVHIARFTAPGLPDGFVALLYIPASGEYGFVNSAEKDKWAPWLTTELAQLRRIN